jgi:energy-coupling factor transport system ATP-binding protein
MKVINVNNVTFKYEESDFPVINDLSLSVEKGEYLCILGENGSGKSTLARLINGLLTPNNGRVEVFGFNTSDKSKQYEVRKRVGMVFQNPDNQMVATMVEDDIAFGPENLGIEPKEIGNRINFALKATNIEEFRFTQGQKLSGGQKQRVAIAGVLAIMPDVLILDESTSMLDGKGRKEVLDVVKKLNKEQKTTVINITHYMDEVVDCDKVLVINDGQIAMFGTPSEIFNQRERLNQIGLELPFSARLADALIKRGVKLPSGVLTERELKDLLCALK